MFAFNSAKSWARLDTSVIEYSEGPEPAAGEEDTRTKTQIRTSVLYERQFSTNLAGGGGTPTYLIPEQWDYTWNTIREKSGMTRAEREQTVAGATAQNLNDLNLGVCGLFLDHSLFPP